MRIVEGELDVFREGLRMAFGPICVRGVRIESYFYISIMKPEIIVLYIPLTAHSNQLLS
jgi:hypothetical protein